MSEFIPQDLILKILSRLPPKSLIKFKCVSKSWNSLISSSYFVSLQTKHAATISKPTVLILIMHCFDTMYREIYSVYNDNNDEFSLHNTTRIKIPRRGVARFHYRMIMGSCNGVLCIYTGDDSIVLWNPVIRRRFALPMPQWEYKNVFVLGFGFDVERNDYKVVKLTHVREGILSIITPPKIEVYSLSARSWREINVEIPRHRVTRSLLNQVFVNRNVHWVAFRREEKRKNFIMAFDISLEVFSEISLPKPLVHWSKSILKPMVIEESLAVCQHKHKHTFCSIWIMKKYGDVESWSNLFNVSLARVYRIHGSGKNGDLLLTRRDQRLFSYNLETRERVDIGIPGMKDLFYVGSSVESLALMNEGEEAHGPFDTQSESD